MLKTIRQPSRFILNSLAVMTLSTAILCAAPQYSAAQDAPSNEAAAAMNNDKARAFALAGEIVKNSSIEPELKRTIDNLAQRVPANRRVLFRSIMERSIKVDRVNAAAQLAYIEVFTLQELEAMHKFYTSPEGKSVQKKMPEFHEKLKPLIQSMVEDAVQNIQNSNLNLTR